MQYLYNGRKLSKVAMIHPMFILGMNIDKWFYIIPLNSVVLRKAHFSHEIYAITWEKYSMVLIKICHFLCISAEVPEPN